MTITGPRRNCWEAKRCGREEGGENISSLGVCPVAIAQHHDSVNGGLNGGRFCWAVVGTLCGSQVQGTFARKLDSCLKCPFYKEVEEQEDGKFTQKPRFQAVL